MQQLTAVCSFAAVALACTPEAGREAAPAAPASASVSAAHAVPAGVTLPATGATGPAMLNGTRVIVSERAIALDDPATVIVELPSRAAVVESGVGERHKRSGPNDLLIVPLTNALAKRAEREAHLFVDARTPYRLLVEVLYTLGQANVGKYHFVLRGGSELTTVTTVPPTVDARARARADEIASGLASALVDLDASASAPPPPPEPAAPSEFLHLTALIVSEGIAVKVAAGNVAPGCETLAAGLTVPRRADGHDFEALTACAEKLKASHPSGAQDDVVTLTANPDTEYQTLVRVMDALRATRAGGRLFPTVQFGVVR